MRHMYHDFDHVNFNITFELGFTIPEFVSFPFLPYIHILSLTGSVVEG